MWPQAFIDSYTTSSHIESHILAHLSCPPPRKPEIEAIMGAAFDDTAEIKWTNNEKRQYSDDHVFVSKSQ